MARIHQPAEWRIHEQADMLHQQGLVTSTTGMLDQARDYYGQSETLLNDLVQTPDVAMQSGRLHRDIGFTYVRELAVSNNPSSSEIAELTGSARTHFNLAINNIFGQLNANGRYSGTPRERDIYSERGATRSLLGRMAIAKEVAVGDVNLSPPTAEIRRRLREEQRDFGKKAAHKDLRAGSNMYYLVSNAMHGARAERLNASKTAEYAYVLPWLGRAAVGLLRADGKLKTVSNVVRQSVQELRSGSGVRAGIKNMAVAAQRTEFGSALVTAARIGSTMRSRSASIASIRSTP